MKLKMLVNYGHLKAGKVITPIGQGFDFVVIRHRGSSLNVPLTFTTPFIVYEVEKEEEEYDGV